MRLATDVAVGLSAVASNVLTGRPERIKQRTPRIISRGVLELDKPARRQLQAAAAGTDGADAKCDGAFLKCILSETCRGCFASMQENDVDWANVVPDTPCQDVLGKFYQPLSSLDSMRYADTLSQVSWSHPATALM